MDKLTELKQWRDNWIIDGQSEIQDLLTWAVEQAEMLAVVKLFCELQLEILAKPEYQKARQQCRLILELMESEVQP